MVVIFVWVLKKCSTKDLSGRKTTVTLGFHQFLRSWFKTLIRTIHVVDNLSGKTKENKKLWKIRPWLENLRQNILKVSLEEFNSVDEIMIPFKGRSFLHQYLPSKHHKWGFKIWEHSSISGLLCDFNVYQGCSNRSNSTFGESGDVVANLCPTLPKQESHTVFADNFFTTLPFIQHLKSDGVWYTGTICSSH